MRHAWDHLETSNTIARLRLISGFLADRRGNVAVITALSALPVITAIGCVIDYSMATMIKTKLQAAADAATLAAVSSNSPMIATAITMTGNGAVTDGPTYTQNFFDFEFGQRAGEHLATRMPDPEPPP